VINDGMAGMAFREAFLCKVLVLLLLLLLLSAD